MMRDHTAEQERLQLLLSETVALLCKNGVHFTSGLQIHGLLGTCRLSTDKFGKPDALTLMNVNRR